MSDEYFQRTITTVKTVTLLVNEYHIILEQINLTERNKNLLHRVFFNDLPFKPISNTNDIGNYLYDLIYENIHIKFPQNSKRIINEFLFLKNNTLISDLNKCLDIIIKIKDLNKNQSTCFMNEEINNFLDNLPNEIIETK